MNIENLTRRSFNALVTASIPFTHTNAPNAQDTIKMGTRIIPSSGESIPVIGLGTSSSFMVDPLNLNGIRQRKDVLKALFQFGGSFIDTAPMYRGSEKLVGDLCKELKITNEAFLATKVLQAEKVKGEVELENSFKLLQKKPIDLIQVHNLVDTNRKLALLNERKQNGHYRYIGATHWRPNIQDSLIPIIKSKRLDFVQFQYNIEERAAENYILPMARDHGVATIINVPFGRGKLFKHTKGHTIPVWATSFAKTWGEFYLKYIISHDSVTCVIPATSKPHHMLENAEAGMGQLPNLKQRRKMVNYIKSI